MTNVQYVFMAMFMVHVIYLLRIKLVYSNFIEASCLLVDSVSHDMVYLVEDEQGTGRGS